MTIENKEFLRSTNDFALTGIKFLYLINGGAILAILANLNNFIEEEYPGISTALILFICGLLFAFLTNFSGYLLYRDIFISIQNQRKSKYEIAYGGCAIFFAVISFISFGFGSYKAVSILN